MELRIVETASSTNDAAKALAKSGAGHGDAVLAYRQTAGRGRMGRQFASPAGGVYLSVVLRPTAPLSELLHLTPVLAVAACDAVEAVCGVRPRCKWVNDLLLGGKKLAGILVESAGDALVAGIGVNVNTAPDAFPAELRGIATSLAAETGRESDRELLARELARRFADACDTAISAQRVWMDRYRADCVTVGRRVTAGELEGLAVSVADDGALLVETADGPVPIRTGEAQVAKL
ncbi:MAG: biotin--[Oscillospiraceae bacterium]|nr:biotin--[acetyl-CoA-carboxylase] ligase [Oscillospiraceae bacterium]